MNHWSFISLTLISKSIRYPKEDDFEKGTFIKREHRFEAIVAFALIFPDKSQTMGVCVLWWDLWLVWGQMFTCGNDYFENVMLYLGLDIDCWLMEVSWISTELKSMWHQLCSANGFIVSDKRLEYFVWIKLISQFKKCCCIYEIQLHISKWLFSLVEFLKFPSN